MEKNNFNTIKNNTQLVIEYFVLANKDSNEEMTECLDNTRQSLKGLYEKCGELECENTEPASLKLNLYNQQSKLASLIVKAEQEINRFIIQMAQFASAIDSSDADVIESKARSLMVDTFKAVLRIHTELNTI